jgi:hypothetical protein
LRNLCFCKNEQRNKNEAQRHKKRVQPSKPQSRAGSHVDPVVIDNAISEPTEQPSAHRHVPQARPVEAQINTLAGSRDTVTTQPLSSPSVEATERRESVESLRGLVDRIRQEVEDGRYNFGDSDPEPFDDLASPCPEITRVS